MVKKLLPDIAVIFLSVILGGSFTLIYFGWRTTAPPPSRQATSLPQPLPAFSWAAAPSQTLTGQVLAVSGDFTWQSRTATAPAAFLTPPVLQQGDSLFAGASGSALISFPPAAGLAVYPKTRLNIIQTLPSDLVFEQLGGRVDYSASSSSPLSVRAAHLLVRLTAGSLSVAFNTPSNRITVTVSTGSATLAFNDLNLQTQVATLSARRSYLYNDATRRGYSF